MCVSIGRLARRARQQADTWITRVCPESSSISTEPSQQEADNWSRNIAAEAQKYGIEERVDVIDGGNLAVLIEMSLGVVTVKSTVGVTALLAYKPVLVLGWAIYDQEGLSHQSSMREFRTSPQAPDADLREAFADRLNERTYFRSIFISMPAMETGVRNLANGSRPTP